jgi:hypothetical protein
MRQSRQLVRTAALAAVMAASAAPAAMAAGGAHVIDDANVETPGVCHLESWATRYDDNATLLNLAPACTRLSWPALELGGAITVTSGKGGDTVLGPALKLNLRAASEGVGVALIGSAAYSPRDRQVQSASLIAPVTFVLNDRVIVNVNAGWTYTRASRQPHQIFAGAQLETQVWRDVGFMFEGFRRSGDPSGMQAGLRWTPNQGRVDVDLLISRYVDGVSPHAFTLGLTVRR